jgi:hypothetical protein
VISWAMLDAGFTMLVADGPQQPAHANKPNHRIRQFTNPLILQFLKYPANPVNPVKKTSCLLSSVSCILFFFTFFAFF